jgi:serine/threonine protein kinase
MNVLIDDCGNAVLCDFGLSRIKSDVTARTPNTSKAVSPGSLYWMAPELFCGEDLSKESDVYAFGMILFEASLILHCMHP